MKITSDRWQILSSAIVLVGMLYFAAEAFSRGATRDLAWGSLLLWNSIWLIPSFWWWRRNGQSVQAAMGAVPLRARILVIPGGLTIGGLSVVGGHLLEQNSLGIQVLGGVLFGIASLALPAWFLWTYRLARRSMNAETV